MCDEWNEMTNHYNDTIDALNDKIKMIEAKQLDNDKKMIVMMLNEVKAIFQLPAGHEREMLVKLENKLFNKLLFAFNIYEKEMRITT